jgi:hypothetical protein
VPLRQRRWPRRCAARLRIWRRGKARARVLNLPERTRCLPRIQNRAFPRCAQGIGKGFPSGSACAGRAVRNSVREIWSVRSPRRGFPTPAGGCRRHDTAPRPCGRGKGSSGPCCTKCRRVVVIGSIVRKDSPLKRCGKVETEIDVRRGWFGGAAVLCMRRSLRELRFRGVFAEVVFYGELRGGVFRAHVADEAEDGALGAPRAAVAAQRILDIFWGRAIVCVPGVGCLSGGNE